MEKLEQKIYVLYFILSCLIGLVISLMFLTAKNESRLDEHKKVIIELTNKHNATINYLKAKEIYERNK